LTLPQGYDRDPVLMLESRKRSEPTILDSGASGILSLDNMWVKMNLKASYT